MARHFEQLPSEAQTLLAAASVAGREFAVAAVAATIDRTVDDVEAQCTALAHRGQLMPVGGIEEWPDGTVAARYGFRHDLYREIVYDRVPVSRRVQLRAATLHVRSREVQLARVRAEAAITLCTEQGFPQWWAQAMVLRGWTLAMQGQGDAGSTQIRQGLDAWRATGAELAVPFFLGLLAEAYAAMGRAEDGLIALTEALSRVHHTGERRDEAALHWLQGALLLARSPHHQAEAETCFRQALEVAGSQQARSWELRAAVSLTRLWQR